MVGNHCDLALDLDYDLDPDLDLSLALSPVVSRPVVTSHSDDLYVRPGDSVSLHCAVVANPVPQVTWTVGDDPLPRDDRYRLSQRVTSQEDVLSYVNISRVRVEDGGVYNCTATNQQGEVSHVTKLNVYGEYYRKTRLH